MDDSEPPITVSEIPPKKESSGLSLFNRLGERSVSQFSESSIKSQKSSSSKSLKQTFIENWITVTTSQSQTTTINADQKLPPWATTGSKHNNDVDFSFGSTPLSNRKGEDICETGSECSLPVIDEKSFDKPDNFKENDKSILNVEEYSIMANDFGSILSEEELYGTPRPDLSPNCNLNEKHPPFHAKNTDGSAAYNTLDTMATAPYDCNRTSQLTVPYNYDNSSQATIPYNHDNSSQATIPYNQDDSSQATVPYDHCGGSQETIPYNSNTDSQSEDHYTANEYSPAVLNDMPNIVEDILGNEETNSPFIASPPEILEETYLLNPEVESIPSPPDIGYEELEEIVEIADRLSSKEKRQHDQIESIETIQHEEPQSSTKIQKLNPSLGQKYKTDPNKLELPEIVKLVRPEKKQIRSSTLKQPMTIENYFLFSSETNRQGVKKEDIGRDSITPSSYSGKSEGVKEDDKPSIKPMDSRKRPSFGLSKKV